MADEDRNDEREEPEDKELEDDDSDLAKILDDMEVSDEELIEVLLGRNSDCDEAAIKVEAERRIQQTGSVVAAYKSAASQAESAMVDMLAEVEKAAKEFSPLFDLADELAERLEAEAVTEPPAKPEPEPEPEPAPEAKKANEKLNSEALDTRPAPMIPLVLCRQISSRLVTWPEPLPLAATRTRLSWSAFWQRNSCETRSTARSKGKVPARESCTLQQDCSAMRRRH